MKVIDKLKSKTMNEFIDWLDEYCRFEDSPWIQWWNKNYCSKCPAIKSKYEDSDRELNFAWCELHDKCKFFPDMDEAPDSKQIIRMWLESEVE